MLGGPMNIMKLGLISGLLGAALAAAPIAQAGSCWSSNYGYYECGSRGQPIGYSAGPYYPSNYYGPSGYYPNNYYYQNDYYQDQAAAAAFVAIGAAIIGQAIYNDNHQKRGYHHNYKKGNYQNQKWRRNSW